MGSREGRGGIHDWFLRAPIDNRGIDKGSDRVGRRDKVGIRSEGTGGRRGETRAPAHSCHGRDPASGEEGIVDNWRGEHGRGTDYGGRGEVGSGRIRRSTEGVGGGGAECCHEVGGV